jgi:Zn-dependent peptidase ImmA (M78 family)
VEFFLRPVRVGKIHPAFHARARLSRKEQEAITEKIREWLERYLTIEALVQGADLASVVQFTVPDGFPYVLRSVEEAEQAAGSLRRVWDLGLDPIENCSELLEEKGIKVGLVESRNGFDACTLEAEAEATIPVFATNKDLPGDRQRYALARELGHLLLEPQEPLDTEKVWHRFAGAFLAPETAVRCELSNRRQKLELYGLHMLKHKYGLPMRAWASRATELGILSRSSARVFIRKFKQNGWHLIEPGDPYPPEESSRMERLVMQALSEEVISETRAAELLGKPLREFFQEVAQDHGGLPIAVGY